MKGLAAIPILFVAFTTVNSVEIADSHQSSLAFYVVHEKTVEGGRFIDTKQFPKLGFIGQRPDLALTEVEAVTGARTGTIVMDKGKAVGLSENHENALRVTLRPEDGRKFEELTRKNIGSRIVLMLGETPLIAPFVMEATTSPDIQITFPTAHDMQKVEQELRRLVKKP